jgi:hypothetical protein
VEIFRVRHWGINVEVFEVNGAETCAWVREYAFEEQLEEFKGCSVGSNVTREADAIVTNGDAGAIRIVLSDRTSHTTMVWQIYFCLWDGML